MVTKATVEEQLRAINCNFKFFGRAEIKELREVLLPGERIAMCVNGEYEAGIALLVATDFRVLLIDKKPKYLTLKDVRFDMITELDYNNRLLNSTIHIYTPNRELRFTTWSSARLRKLFAHTQHKVMEIRHRFMMQQFQQQHDLENTPPGVTMAYAQQLPAGSPQSPPIIDHSDDQRNLASAMGAAGLQGARGQDGTASKEYTSVPFTQRWRKRPYGYSHDSIPQST